MVRSIPFESSTEPSEPQNLNKTTMSVLNKRIKLFAVLRLSSQNDFFSALMTDNVLFIRKVWLDKG